mmetsp:Transcript_42324/g.134474  ORF Transcript_42324/g.134474 Transcript_42324/m.134474 type:complete len:360 (+) Transcript_42324:313-1392(+)
MLQGSAQFMRLSVTLAKSPTCNGAGLGDCCSVCCSNCRSASFFTSACGGSLPLASSTRMTSLFFRPRLPTVCCGSIFAPLSVKRGVADFCKPSLSMAVTMMTRSLMAFHASTCTSLPCLSRNVTWTLPCGMTLLPCRSCSAPLLRNACLADSMNCCHLAFRGFLLGSAWCFAAALRWRSSSAAFRCAASWASCSAAAARSANFCFTSASARCSTASSESCFSSDSSPALRPANNVSLVLLRSSNGTLSLSRDCGGPNHKWTLYVSGNAPGPVMLLLNQEPALGPSMTCTNVGSPTLKWVRSWSSTWRLLCKRREEAKGRCFCTGFARAPQAASARASSTACARRPSIARRAAAREVQSR